MKNINKKTNRCAIILLALGALLIPQVGNAHFLNKTCKLIKKHPYWMATIATAAIAGGLMYKYRKNIFTWCMKKHFNDQPGLDDITDILNDTNLNNLEKDKNNSESDKNKKKKTSLLMSLDKMCNLSDETQTNPNSQLVETLESDITKVEIELRTLKQRHENKETIDKEKLHKRLQKVHDTKQKMTKKQLEHHDITSAEKDLEKIIKKLPPEVNDIYKEVLNQIKNENKKTDSL